MDTLLVWTLLGAGLGIVLILLLLIASERELRRQRAAVYSRRDKSEGAAVMGLTPGEPEALSDADRGVSAEVAALEQQLQSSLAAVASMQAELDRLQAENAGLRHETSQYAVESSAMRSQPAKKFIGLKSNESAVRASARQPIKTKIRVSIRKPIKTKRRWRFMIRSSAIALLLAAGASAYFASPRRQSLTVPKDQVNGFAHNQFAAKVSAEETNKAETAIEKSLESAGNTVFNGEKPIDLTFQKTPPQTTSAPAGKTDELVRPTKPSENRLETAKPNVSERATPIELVSQKKPPQTTTVPPGHSYEVVLATRVFSEPNESARPVARVEAGMEINVIGVRGEWLEVRSRHGRPPGFIQKSAAVKRDPN